MSATRIDDSTTRQAVLYMALELSEKTWKLGFSTGLGQEPRQRDIPSRAPGAVAAEIRTAKGRFGLPPEAKVVSCYEAGRDGFWLHRGLTAGGWKTRSSIPPASKWTAANGGPRRTGWT